MKLLKRLFPLGVALIIALSFYYPVFKGNVPIASDALVGLYHPYRDLYSENYPNGMPFKNFLITDPVRQTYVWKELAISLFKTGVMPSWNPYEMSGAPLAANFQSAIFYPLNVILFIAPFSLSWTVFIVLQTVLLLVFTYLYLRNLKISVWPSVIASLSFALSGVAIVWVEWGNLVSTFLWLPLIFLSIDKIFSTKQIKWYGLLVLSLLFSVFAGHIQFFFYVSLFSFAYFMYRLFQKGLDGKKALLSLVSIIVFLVVASIQLIPTLRFIFLSARNVDQDYKTIEGWFIPWQHLVQVIAPDFFGNPATLNYFGTWNYGELVLYIGVLPLLAVLFSFFARKKDILFFGISAVVCLLLALSSPISEFPYKIGIPFLSTSQPTRIIFLVTFCLSVMCAFGLEYILEKKFSKRLLIPVGVLGIAFLAMWMAVVSPQLVGLTFENSLIAKRNLLLPSAFFVASVILLFSLLFIKNKTIRGGLLIVVVLFVGFDLLRFGWKFAPFTNPQYLYPQTAITKYITSQNGQFRVASLDKEIMPPNFWTHYRVQSIEGYDPLYLRWYAEYIVAMERSSSDINPPFGFNRIVTAHNFKSPMFDFLNTKYVLSFNDLSEEKLEFVMSEGRTKLYENKEALPRAFFVGSVKQAVSEKEAFAQLINANLLEQAVVYEAVGGNYSKGSVEIIEYSENKIVLNSQNQGKGFLVLSEVFYPTWDVSIDGNKASIVRTNHAFRGIVVPKGNHTIIMENSLL